MNVPRRAYHPLLTQEKSPQTNNRNGVNNGRGLREGIEENYRVRYVNRTRGVRLSPTAKGR